ncbi:nitrate- and nitrite sensing domain-containing protein [Actinomadura violacea]|uniref:histidine kinase n=1 Tax=Actinomadura violacea TaxID=2819934 RepID=A0ABS3RQG1_9ACTN|nr:nitrate- and nitrite sensing domain-containing protein [Actinomadura violacea]MBO2458982.1 nitrate- and nitrite sensing domain-containing protein [Actinomadura violacea]
MANRFSSIRARITLLVLVPLLALAALWMFLTGITYGDAHQLLQSRKFQQEAVLPTQRLMNALQKERRLSMADAGSGRAVNPGGLRAQRQATDRAVREVRKGFGDGSLRGSILPGVVKRMDDLLARLGTLEATRRGVDDRASGRADVLADYSGIIDAGFAIYSATTPSNGTITADARTLTSVGRGREFLSREDALLTGALAAGHLSAAERGEFAQLVGAQRMTYADNVPNLPAADRARYERLTASPQFAQLRKLEDQVIRGADQVRTVGKVKKPTPGRTGTGTDTGNGTGVTQGAASGAGARTGTAGRPARTTRAPVVDTAQWRTIADDADGRLYDFENRSLDDITGRAQHIAVGVFVRLGIAGGLGLVAVLLSTLIAVRVSRRLLRECRTLAGAVVDFTRKRLPLLAEQVRAGRPAEPEPEPGVDFRIREIRQIADSFDRAREAVLVAAAGEVAARRGISEVFVNLARRNQALLHRQLSLLDTMERRTEDPSELSDLFRLDHLATRMRRHAEGLVILAGKTAGRGWRRPVPLVDVVRGAVAEVEDYPRVRVQPLPRIALLGSAVADVIHLLAEVVENATTFSPPQSPVRVSGHPVANGFAIEVEDRGLGMTEEALRAANARLDDPPEFDPSDSAQLGLFVVARLAERHEIKVTLRQSPYGGTTAIALIPGSLIVDTAEPEPIARRNTGPMRLPAAPAAALSAPARPAVEQGGVVRLVAEAEPVRADSLGAEPAQPAQPETEQPEPVRPEPVRMESGRPEQAPGLTPLPERRRSRRADGPRAAQEPAPAPEPPPASDAEPARPLKEGELPKRRRQTHLAPQLKERVDAHLAARGQAPPSAATPSEPSAPEPAAPEPSLPLAAPGPADAEPAGPGDADAPAGPGDAAPGAGTAPPDVPDPARSPETMRSMMSAMQQGWQRGRRDAAEAEAEAPPRQAPPGRDDHPNRGDQEDDAP